MYSKDESPLAGPGHSNGVSTSRPQTQSTPAVDTLASSALPDRESLFTPPIHQSQTLLNSVPIHALKEGFTDYETLTNMLCAERISVESAKHMQIVKLHKEIDSCSTAYGSAVLLRKLLNPPTELGQINQIRGYLDALAPGQPLRKQVDSFLQTLQQRNKFNEIILNALTDLFDPSVRFAKYENLSFWQEVNLKIYQTFHSHLEHDQLRDAGRFVFKSLISIFNTESEIRLPAIERLAALAKDPSFSLLSEKMFVTPKSREAFAGRADTPLSARFFGYDLGKIALQERLMVYGGAVLSRDLLKVITAGHDRSSFVSLSGAFLTALCLSIVYVNLFRAGFSSLKEKIRESPQAEIPDLIGELDAMCALADLRDRAKQQEWVEPTLVQADRCSLSYKGIRNPTLELVSPGSNTKNDFQLNSGALACFTGPNSGGKSTLCLAIAQNQILAQLGIPVCADEATLSVVDKIAYQGPLFFGLEEEGRLGSELIITRQTLRSATPRSLVVLDEIAGATSHQEGLEIATDTLWAFSKVGCGTIQVTHDFNLARSIEQLGIATCYQMMWDGDNPIYKIGCGISTSSHAMRVAEKVGMSRPQLEEYLRSQGYLSPAE